MRKILFVVISCVTLGWLSIPPLSATTLLVLGDSLSAGYQMPATKAWPILLEQRIDDLNVINTSSSGETSRGGLRRLPSLLSEFQPDWCLLELGGNDALQGQSIQLIKKNIRIMIEQAQQKECQVILSEIKIPSNYGARYTNAFTEIYHELAASYNTPLLPFFVEPIYNQPGMMLSDGIHPNQSAQPIIADFVAEFIDSVINDN